MKLKKESKKLTGMLKRICDRYTDSTFLRAPGLDDAIIGVDEIDMRLVYSVSKCIDILRKDMTEEEAHEYFDFNISGAFMGKQTPVWCYDNYQDEE